MGAEAVLCLSTIPGLSARRDANASRFCWMVVARTPDSSPGSSWCGPLQEPSAGTRLSFGLARALKLRPEPHLGAPFRQATIDPVPVRVALRSVIDPGHERAESAEGLPDPP